MLRLALLVLVVVVQLASAAHVLPIHYTPSLKMKLLREGGLQDFLLRKDMRQSQLSSGSTPVIDYEDMAYMITVTLGTPAQSFVTFIDSGSANLWVPDITCAQGQDTKCGPYCSKTPYATCISFCGPSCCKGSVDYQEAKTATNACTTKRRFNSTLSSTYTPNGQTFAISYSTGDVSGFLGVDKFCFANSTVCVPAQGFGQATSIGDDFNKQPEDGIIGLGWPSLAINQVTPPMFNLLNQGSLDMPLFVVYMAGIGPTSDLNGGQLTVGALDTVNCGDVNYIPLTSQTFWQFRLGGVSAGSYSSTPANGWQAISDTASTLIGGPTAIVEKIAAAVGAKYYPEFQSYFIDCEAETPDIIFNINNVQYNVRPKNYVISVGIGPCMFAMFSQNSGGFYPSWMLGPPLIREFCQVHDMQNARLGMAKVISS